MIRYISSISDYWRIDHSTSSLILHLRDLFGFEVYYLCFSDVLYSIIGASVWVLALITWEIFFQLERAKGLDWTDRLSFVFPVGYV